MKSAMFTVASVILSATLASYGCGRDEANRTDATVPGSATAPNTDAARTSASETRVADIVGSPDKYMGQTVTVIADVQEVLGPLAFSLDEDSPLAGGIDQELLVLSPKAGALREIDDQWTNNKVRVTGKVGKMTVVEVEREVGWDLNPEIEAEVEHSGAVLIASSVERVDRP